MLPSVQALYPTGYTKLMTIVPECQTTRDHNYSACLMAAKLLESNSTEQATTQFMAHWEDTAWGYADRKQKIAESRHSPSDGFVEYMVYGKVKYDEIKATERIVLPTIRKIYTDSGTDYGTKMLKQIDLIDLDSRSSFDVFRDVHTGLLKSAQ
ncbi:MAG TPA: hypothetical protein VII00_06945 [bacterium]